MTVEGFRVSFELYKKPLEVLIREEAESDLHLRYHSGISDCEEEPRGAIPESEHGLGIDSFPISATASHRSLRNLFSLSGPVSSMWG